MHLLFHKPYGVLCTFTDPEGRPTLKEYIPVEGVYAAGRLDYTSEGLLFLSDDGPLIRRLTDPCNAHPKTYWAQVEGQPGAQALAALVEGVSIRVAHKSGGKSVRVVETVRAVAAREIAAPRVSAAAVASLAYRRTAWLEIVLQEGKKHQVRHMTAAVGLPTLRLIRVAIGDLHLGDLAPGEWRALTAEEQACLRALGRGGGGTQKPARAQRSWH